MADHLHGHGELHEESVQNPHVHYEHRDLGGKTIVAFLIGLAVAGLFIHLIVLAMVMGYNKVQNYLGVRETVQATLSNPREQLIEGDPVERFPRPVLQPDPVADLNNFRASNEEILNSYTWVDQKNGVVRIPIERAIDILAQQGLPVRPPQQLPLTAQFGTGESSPEGQGGGTEPRSNQ